MTRFLLKPQEQRLSPLNYHSFTQRLRPGLKRTGYYHLIVGGAPQQPAVFGNMPPTLASPSFRTHTVKRRLVQSDKTSLWCVTACHYQRLFGSESGRYQSKGGASQEQVDKNKHIKVTGGEKGPDNSLNHHTELQSAYSPNRVISFFKKG